MTRPLAIDTHAHFFPPAYIDMISRLGGRCGTTVTRTEQGHYFIQVGLLLRTGPIVPAFYDLDQRIQIPGIRALSMGQTYEYDGYEPKWRGIYDDEGRLMVAINHNMDLGDAWEHADDPWYPNPMTALAYRFAVNYVTYAMTH